MAAIQSLMKARRRKASTASHAWYSDAMLSERKERLSPEEYLALERRAENRSEYLDGDMVAMSGGSREHNLIALNLGAELRSRLKGRPCEVFAGDMRVKVSGTGLYTYPDVVIVCGEPKFEDANVDTLINPTVVAEVLSESTASYDRGGKFAHYRKIPSLVDYLLIAQHEPRIERYVRQPEGPWARSEVRSLDGTLDLPSIQCSVPMAEIYERVFPQ